MDVEQEQMEKTEVKENIIFGFLEFMSLKPPVNPRPVNRGENSETCPDDFLQSHPRKIGSVIANDKSTYPMNRNTQNYEILVFLFNYQYYLGLHIFFHLP